MNDLRIASIPLQSDAMFLTLDQRFGTLPQIPKWM